MQLPPLPSHLAKLPEEVVGPKDKHPDSLLESFVVLTMQYGKLSLQTIGLIQLYNNTKEALDDQIIRNEELLHKVK